MISPDQLNTYDVLDADDLVFSVEALDAYISAQHEEHRGGVGLMATVTDPRDIILAPVISEKSYGLIEDNIYTFVVHPDSNKTQIKIAIEKIFSVKVDSVNTLNRQGKRKRTRAGYGTAQEHQARHRHAGRGQQADRPVRSTGLSGRRKAQRTYSRHGNSQVQADDSGSSRLERLRLRRDHSVDAGEVADPPAAQHGWPQRARPHHHPPQGWWPQARLPRRSTSVATTRTASTPRSRRSSTTRTAPRTSRCCTTSTARSATSSRRKDFRRAT